MTEKRFRLGYVCGDFGLIDNDKWIDLHSMSENSEKNVQICINKMNDLADENEQLKKDVEYWKQVASQYSNELNVFEHCKKYKTECKDIYWSSD